MAENCVLPKISGRTSFPYKVFAFFEILPSAKITISIAVTFEAPWSFSFRMLGPDTFPPSPPQPWSSAPLVQLCRLSIHSWPIVLQSLICVNSCVPSNPHFSILCDWQWLMVIPLVVTLYPVLNAYLPVYPHDYLVMALPILSLDKFFCIQ